MQHQQKAPAKQNMPSDDSRLSQLPDDILCHILSFLRTKHSVATSILSRRWKFLWTHVPTLNFDIEYYAEGYLEADIIRKVLSLHKVKNLDTLRLSYISGNSDDSKTWITNIFARNIKHLYLYFGELPYEIILPPCLFKCKSLVDLDLSCCEVIPTTESLPNLRVLHLFCVRFDSDQSLPQLLSCCPILEKLNIRNCNVRGPISHCNLYISSPSIKSLAISNHRCDFRKVVVNAPALRTLDVSSTCELISFAELKSLTEAVISLSCLGWAGPFEKDKFYIYLLNVLNSLCNVKSLRLSIDHVEFNDITLAESTFLMSSSVRFDNLTKLELGTHGIFLRKFLEAANNLEVLIYYENCVEDGEDQKYWKEPEQLPSCLTSHLRSITIEWFRLEEHEFEMIKYLLRNAKVLEKMEIECFESGEWKVKLNEVQMILGFSRGSEACELEFL